MNRRRALLIASSFSALTMGWFGIHLKDEQEVDIRFTIIADHLRKELPYLQISQADIDLFSHDHLGWLSSTRQPLRLSGDITKTFLLSSDFFLNDQSESRPLTYLGYYDPYLRGCGNTIARAT